MYTCICIYIDTHARGREIIISLEGDNYFAGRRYLFRGKDLLFRGREIIISREGLIISREGDNIIFQPVLSEPPYYSAEQRTN